MSNNKLFLIGIIMFLTVTFIGCDQKVTNEADTSLNNEKEEEQENSDATDNTKDQGDESEQPSDQDSDKQQTESEPIDPASFNANELGQVMVLMYHHINEPEDTWVRTPDNFKKDLQELYDQGFRPVSLQDYATGNIEIEPGYKPVVITFDDGRQNNFNMIQDSNGDWVTDPDSAVGILVDFHVKNPDFPLEATFFINGGTPFEQEEWVEYKLNFIVDQGMDIGNHSYNHPNFSQLSAEELQYQLGKLNNMVTGYLPDYEVNTLALPFGSRPENEKLMQYLHKGSYDGENYENIAILEVGWDPYFSPFHQDFNPLKIRRVRASEMNVDGVGIYDWLKHFNSGARTPYVSDGSKEAVSFPEAYDNLLNEGSTEHKTIQRYETDD